MASWYIYIVRCADNTLYTGIATDVVRRVAEHNQASNGAKYIRGRRPVSLVYVEMTDSRASASKRERRIKALRRVEKERLISQSGFSPASYY